MTARERTEEDRTSVGKDRASEERVTMERPSIDRWSPATALETPPPTGGFSYRWIAESVNGEMTPRNVQMAIREGYIRVTINELMENHPDFVACVEEDVRGDGMARTGGLILMRMPEEFAKQRRAHYRNQSREASRAANTLQGIASADQVVEDRSRQLVGAQQARNAAGPS